MTRSSGYGVHGSAVGLAAAAVDNVRLSYHYLDVGDRDGYDSLFHPDAVLRCPAGVHRRGVHSGLDLFASGYRVAAVGRFNGRMPACPVDTDFADIFTVTEYGLIIAKTSYYYAAPG